MTERRNGSNWTLIAGVSLPVIVLIGFLLYSYIARQTAEPPGYDAIFSMYINAGGEALQQANLSYSVEGDRIVVSASGRALPAVLRSTQALYRLDHETLTATRITFDEPEQVTGSNQVIEVPELDGLRVTPEIVAPDGYRFRSGYDRGPGIIGALFSPRRSGGVTIEKLGVVHRLNTPEKVEFSGYARFLGWVVE